MGGQACNHFCNKPKREPITLFFTSSQSCLVIVDWMDISVVQFLIAYQMNYCQTFLHCTCHLKEDLPGALEAVRDGGVMPPTPLPSDLGRWVNPILTSGQIMSTTSLLALPPDFQTPYGPEHRRLFLLMSNLFFHFLHRRGKKEGYNMCLGAKALLLKDISNFRDAARFSNPGGQ